MFLINRKKIQLNVQSKWSSHMTFLHCFHAKRKTGTEIEVDSRIIDYFIDSYLT